MTDTPPCLPADVEAAGIEDNIGDNISSLVTGVTPEITSRNIARLRKILAYERYAVEKAEQERAESALLALAEQMRDPGDADLVRGLAHAPAPGRAAKKET